MKGQIKDICGSYNKACSMGKPLTAEDRRRHIVAYEYIIQLDDEKGTQRVITRAENFNIGDNCVCLDTGFRAEVLTKTPIKEDGVLE